MKNRHLPDWLLILFGLSTYTPRGLAARYADSAHRGRVLKPVFEDAPATPDEVAADTPPEPNAPAPAPVVEVDTLCDAAARHAA